LAEVILIGKSRGLGRFIVCEKQVPAELGIIPADLVVLPVHANHLPADLKGLPAQPPPTQFKNFQTSQIVLINWLTGGERDVILNENDNHCRV
jgi:hypothetical protein